MSETVTATEAIYEVERLRRRAGPGYPRAWFMLEDRYADALVEEVKRLRNTPVVVKERTVYVDSFSKDTMHIQVGEAPLPLSDHPVQLWGPHFQGQDASQRRLAVQDALIRQLRAQLLDARTQASAHREQAQAAISQRDEARLTATELIGVRNSLEVQLTSMRGEVGVKAEELTSMRRDIQQMGDRIRNHEFNEVNLNALLDERNKLLHAIPACPHHGADCVRHAIEWVKQAAGLAQTITELKTAAEAVSGR